MSTSLKRFAVSLLGAYAIVAQVVFLREFLVIFFGNELCLGVIFSSWFLGVALGAAASARPARRTAAGEGPFLIVSILLALVSPGIVFLIRAARSLLSVPPGEYIPFFSLLFSTWALVLPFSFLLGFVFPFACLLALGASRSDVRNIGRVYILEAAGSVAGGALFSFVLVGRFSSFHVLFGAGALLLGVIALIAWEGGRAWRRSLVPGALCAAFLAVLLSGGAKKTDTAGVLARWRSLNPRLDLVTSRDSRYENIALSRREEQYDLFGNGRYFSSFPDPYGYASMVHMIMAEHPKPSSVLLIGGGAGGAIGELRKYGLRRLDYVELDPALITVIEPYLDEDARLALRGPPVTVHYGDGRRFVKTAGEKYDMIIVNVPDPSTAMLNRFYTREFFGEARRRLEPGGVLVVRLRAPAGYYGRDVANYAGSVYRTLRAVFPHVIVTPTEENYFFASMSPGVVTSDIPLLEKRWEARGIETPYFTPYHFGMWWLPGRVEFVRRTLSGMTGAPLNTDFRPATYFFNLKLWARFSGSRVTGALDALERAGPAWYVFPIVLLFLARIAYIAVSRKRGERQRAFHALLSVGTTGFAAMALELVLVFSFQSIYGYVYQMLGLIVALFMAGLAVGGYCSNRLLIRPGRRWSLWLAGMDLLLAGYLLAVPPLVRGIGGTGGWTEGAFMGLVVIAGFLTGVAFPAGSKIYMIRAASLGRTAALVDAWDHVGACVGSMVIGVAALPLLGLGATCCIVALMKICTGTLLVVTRAHDGVSE